MESSVHLPSEFKAIKRVIPNDEKLNNKDFEIIKDEQNLTQSTLSRLVSLVSHTPTLAFEKKEFREKVKFCIAQLEVGRETHRVHWQGKSTHERLNKYY